MREAVQPQPRGRGFRECGCMSCARIAPITAVARVAFSLPLDRRQKRASSPSTRVPGRRDAQCAGGRLPERESPAPEVPHRARECGWVEPNPIVAAPIVAAILRHIRRTAAANLMSEALQAFPPLAPPKVALTYIDRMRGRAPLADAALQVALSCICDVGPHRVCPMPCVDFGIPPQHQRRISCRPHPHSTAARPRLSTA